MIRKCLFAAMAMGLTTQALLAQDYDNRFYIAPYAGVDFTDGKRNTDNGLVLGLGIGRFFTQNFSLDLDINHSSSDIQARSGSWINQGIGLTGRLFFGDSSNWRPYGLLGLGSLKHDRSDSPTGRALEFKAGLGIQNNVSDRVAVRGEVAYRYDQDDESLLNQNDYSDWLANIGLNFALGEAGAAPAVSKQAEDMGEPKADMPAAEAPPAETPAAEPMMEKDGDKDGVMDESDKCLESPAGSMVNREGCPVEEVIDLRGVNFDFDKCNLRPDAVVILDNAVSVLKDHALTVSVEGHTDSIGTDAYNQRLSECRANVVYEYLTGHGVDAAKLTGHRGFGEAKPIDDNKSAAGRANNRRTELVKQ
jgi:OmpA-OmpF porin, OOP family